MAIPGQPVLIGREVHGGASAVGCRGRSLAMDCPDRIGAVVLTRDRGGGALVASLRRGQQSMWPARTLVAGVARPAPARTEP